METVLGTVAVTVVVERWPVVAVKAGVGTLVPAVVAAFAEILDGVLVGPVELVVLVGVAVVEIVVVVRSVVVLRKNATGLQVVCVEQAVGDFAFALTNVVNMVPARQGALLLVHGQLHTQGVFHLGVVAVVLVVVPRILLGALVVFLCPLGTDPSN